MAPIQADTALVLRCQSELATVSQPVPAAQVAQVGADLLGEQRWDEFRARGSMDVSMSIDENTDLAELVRKIDDTLDGKKKQ